MPRASLETGRRKALPFTQSDCVGRFLFSRRKSYIPTGQGN
jgi:hypothetical protein